MSGEAPFRQFLKTSGENFDIMIGFVFIMFSLAMAADIPMMLNYQGYVEHGEAGNRIPFDGNGFFKFAIVDPNGNTTYWSNDGTSTAADEPDNAVMIPVTFQMYWETSNDQLRLQAAESSTAGNDISWNNAITINASGKVGIGTTSPEAKLHVATETGDGDAFIRASNFNPIPKANWPDFDANAPYLLKNALWVGWDDSKKAWKYTRESDNDRGVTDPGDPAAWVVNGEDTGYFDGDLDTLPPGIHINNRYNPKMMAYRCNQDDIQVKVGSFWMAFSQKARASTGMTWFVAAQAAVNAGKRLPTNAEWQASALGTERNTGNGITNGSDWSTIDDQDVSRYGIVGMVGNVWQ